MSNSTEQKIIDNTIKLIGQEGYQKISLRKLTKQSNVTTGAFYKHFKDKNELFYRVSLILSQKIVDYLQVESKENPLKQLLKIAQGFCKLFKTNPQQMDFLFFNPTVIKVYQQDSHDFSFLTLVRNLAVQVNPGQLTDEDFFNQIWAFIQGYALLIKKRVTDYDPKLVETTLLALTGGAK